MIMIQVMIACLVMLTVSVGAQEKPVPPKRVGAVPVDSLAPGEQKLPEIDLPEFQITGDETIDLPQFSKTATDEQNRFDALSLKPSPGQREPAALELGAGIKDQVGFDGVPAGVNGKVKLGYGLYQTPLLDGWFGKNFENMDFLLKSGYTSSKGYHANADFRKAHSSLAVGSYLSEASGLFSSARIQGSVGFRGDGYSLYGSDVPSRERTVNGFLADVSLGSLPNTSFTSTSGLHLLTTSMSDSVRTRETQIGLDVSASKDVDGFDLKGDVSLWSGIYSMPSKTGTPYYSRIGFSARHTIGEGVDIVGGVGIYFARGSDADGIVRLYPKLGISWYTNNWMTVFARYEPTVQRTTFAQIVDANPYVWNDVRLRHQEVFHSVSAGVEAEISRKIKTRISLNHRIVRNQLMFVDAASRGMWTAEYTGVTRTVSFEADMYADLTERDHLAGSFELRSNRNSASDKSIPYYPSALLSALYQHRFPFGLLLGTKAQLVGQQYADVGNTSSLKGFILFDLTAEYLIGEGFGVSGTMNNVFNTPHRWWQGYQTTPRMASVALTYIW